MKDIFNTLIDSFINNKVGIANHFLSHKLSAELRLNLEQLHTANHMQTAGIGDNLVFQKDQLFRSDIIYWLDRSHNNPFENNFFDVMDQFVEHLNSTCYTGITSYEFHYTLYEQGSFYKKHLDQFRGNDSRKYSMIMYLNEHWQQGDGGELCIHHDDHLENIAPQNGRSVFFKSNELEHEVLITNKPRMSTTGWLKS